MKFGSSAISRACIWDSSTRTKLGLQGVKVQMVHHM